MSLDMLSLKPDASLQITGWAWVQVGTSVTEIRERAGTESQYPVLSVTKHRGILPAIEYFKKQVHGKDLANYKIVRRGQIAYATIHLDEGSAGILRDYEAGLVSPMYTVLEVNGKVDSEYLLLVLKATKSQALFKALGQGTVNRRASIQFRALSQLFIYLPPLPEQRKITTIIASVNEMIERSTAVIERLRHLKTEVARDLLQKGLHSAQDGSKSNPWPNRTLGDEAAIGNGSTPSKINDDYWQNGTIPWLPTGKVNDEVIISPSHYVTPKAVAECSLKLLPRGTTLVAMIGQGKTRGKAAYLEVEACVNQNFAYVIPGERLNPRFLYYYLDFQYPALRASGRGSNQDALNCGILKKFPLPLPPLPEQRRIADALGSIRDRIDKEVIAAAALVSLKEALTNALLTGQIRVTPHEATS